MHKIHHTRKLQDQKRDHTREVSVTWCLLLIAVPTKQAAIVSELDLVEPVLASSLAFHIEFFARCDEVIDFAFSEQTGHPKELVSSLFDPSSAMQTMCAACPQE